MANRINMPSKAEMQKAFEEAFPDRSVLPKARGWRMLVMMPKPKTQTAGGIELPEDYVQTETVASPIGYVVQQGPLCYKDAKKFPGGEKWCEEGDIIFFRSYTGTRVVINGLEFRSISDESVEMTVDDPRGIERI